MRLPVSITLCERPVTVTDGLGRKHIVNCCNCAACDKSRCASYSEKLLQEMRHHKFVWFITLTYDNDFATYYYPRTRLISRYNFKLNRRVYHTVSEFTKSDTRLLKQLKFPRYVESSRPFAFSSGVKALVSIPKDATDFIKRLRRSLGTSDFRFSLALEYGPKTNRPHFHGVILSNNPLVGNSIDTKFIVNAWKHSSRTKRVCERVSSKDKCSRYVSKYVSKLTNVLPCFKVRPFKPFYHNSRYPAFGTYSLLPLGRLSALSSIASFTEDRSYFDQKLRRAVPRTTVIHNQYFKGCFCVPSFLQYARPYVFKRLRSRACSSFRRSIKKEFRDKLVRDLFYFYRSISFSVALSDNYFRSEYLSYLRPVFDRAVTLLFTLPARTFDCLTDTLTDFEIFVLASCYGNGIDMVYFLCRSLSSKLNSIARYTHTLSSSEYEYFLSRYSSLSCLRSYTSPSALDLSPLRSLTSSELSSFASVPVSRLDPVFLAGLDYLKTFKGSVTSLFSPIFVQSVKIHSNNVKLSVL